jgi:NAD/NADP transhydrogenase beta subunit
MQVGFAAVSTSIANYMIASDPAMAGLHSLDTVHKVTAYLGTIIGAVTLTGSAVAFGKLHGIMPSKPLNLPGTLSNSNFFSFHFLFFLFFNSIIRKLLQTLFWCATKPEA